MVKRKKGQYLFHNSNIKQPCDKRYKNDSKYSYKTYTKIYDMEIPALTFYRMRQQQQRNIVCVNPTATLTPLICKNVFAF